MVHPWVHHEPIRFASLFSFKKNVPGSCCAIYRYAHPPIFFSLLQLLKEAHEKILATALDPEREKKRKEKDKELRRRIADLEEKLLQEKTQTSSLLVSLPLRSAPWTLFVSLSLSKSSFTLLLEGAIKRA